MCPKYRNCEFCGYYHQNVDNTFECLCGGNCDDMFQCVETDCNRDCISE